MYEEPFSASEASPVPTAKAPRTFGEIPGLWLRFFQMNESFFAAEAPRASDSNTIISLVVMVVISTVFSVISSIITSSARAILIPELQEFAIVGIGSGIMGALCGGLCFGLIGALLGFYISNGLIYLCARLFGGKGDFSTQTYLVSLFTIPLSVIGQGVGIVFSLPVLLFHQMHFVLMLVIGLVMFAIGLGIAIYTIVLYARALKVTHGLSTGMAVLATLLPTVVFVGLIACVTVAILVLLGPTISEVFEEIMWELQQYQS